MLISDRNGFIFIRIPKTAGTSISRALAPYANARTLSPWRAVERALPVRVCAERAWFEMHDTAAFVKAKLPERDFERYFRFAFVRSPYSHAYSHYQFLKHYRYRHYARQVARMSFLDYLHWRIDGAQRPIKTRVQRFVFMGDQAHYIRAPSGELLVDFVGRFEQVEADLQRIADHLRIPRPPLTHKRRGRYSVTPAPERLHADVLSAIHWLYARDFDLFDYTRIDRPSASPEGDIRSADSDIRCSGHGPTGPFSALLAPLRR